MRPVFSVLDAKRKTGFRPVFSILDAQEKNRVPSCFSNFGRSSDNETAQEDAPATASDIQPEVQDEDEDGEWESIGLDTGVEGEVMLTASASTIQPDGDAEPRGRSKYKGKSRVQNEPPVERLGGIKKRQATMLRFVARDNDDDNTPVKENGKRVSHSLSAEKARKRPLVTSTLS